MWQALQPVTITVCQVKHSLLFKFDLCGEEGDPDTKHFNPFKGPQSTRL